VRTKAELEYLITKKSLAAPESLTQRELSESEIRRMPEPVYEWHLQNNAKNVEAALNAPKIQAENKRNAATATAQRFWNNRAPEEDVKQAQKATALFKEKYPQVRFDYTPNIEALNTWLRAKNLLITFPNLVQAFETLTQEGKLLLDPSALGISNEDEVSGHRLKTHPSLYKLLEPVPTAEELENRRKKNKYNLTAEEKEMSAKQYREAHKEDWRETSISARHQQDWDKAIGFFLQAHPEFARTESNRKKVLQFIVTNGGLEVPKQGPEAANGLQINPQGLEAAFQALKLKGELELNEGAVQQGQVVGYTNLAGTEIDARSGFVANDTNLTAKINKMSAKEYSVWLQSPSNRKAANEILTAKAR